jgi:hypothetical protein
LLFGKSLRVFYRMSNPFGLPIGLLDRITGHAVSISDIAWSVLTVR